MLSVSENSHSEEEQTYHNTSKHVSFKDFSSLGQTNLGLVGLQSKP